MVIRKGTVLIWSARPSRRPALIKELFFGDSWQRFDRAKIRMAAEESMIFTWVIANANMATAVALDAKLRGEVTYLGCMAVNRLVPSQRALFRSMLPLFLRVRGTSCNMFHSSLSPDDRDNVVFEEVKELGFSSVDWEDIGARDSVFDDFDTNDHFERIEALRHFLTANLLDRADGADELVLVLEDLNPRLAATLGTASRAFFAAISEEDRAHVGLSARRYIEQLADALYPPQKDLVDGRDVSKAKVKNRVWAYIIEQCADHGPNGQDRAQVIGKEFDEILEDANAILHAAPRTEQVRSLLVRLALMTATLLGLAEGENRRPYLGYSPRIRELLLEWFGLPSV
jgi:hypothetical protein